MLSGYKMKLLRFSPSSFIHFGTTRELLRLMTEEMPLFSFLDWSPLVNTNCTRSGFAVSHSYVSRRASVGAGSYIEDSYIHKNTVVGKDCVISGVTLDGGTVPDGTVLSGLKLKNGKFVVPLPGEQIRVSFPHFCHTKPLAVPAIRLAQPLAWHGNKTAQTRVRIGGYERTGKVAGIYRINMNATERLGASLGLLSSKLAERKIRMPREAPRRIRHALSVTDE